jgi:hypothetical protein
MARICVTDTTFLLRGDVRGSHTASIGWKE